MLLGSGDLRNALLTVSKLLIGYKELNIQLNDDYDIITARNVLLAHIILSDDFDPAKPSDLAYLWDVWYSLQWLEETKQRFIKDIQNLLSGNLAARCKIDPFGFERLNSILHSWLAMASGEVSSVSIDNIGIILLNRYFNKFSIYLNNFNLTNFNFLFLELK